MAIRIIISTLLRVNTHLPCKKSELSQRESICIKAHLIVIHIMSISISPMMTLLPVALLKYKTAMVQALKGHKLSKVSAASRQDRTICSHRR